MPVQVICVPKLLGGASMIIDDQPEGVVIWLKEGLPGEEVAQMLADVWTVNTGHGHYERHQLLSVA